MWCSHVSKSRLDEASAWKVEFFCEGASDSLSSSYPSAPVAAIARERKDSVEPSLQPAASFSYIGLENVESHTGRLTGFEPRLGADIRSRSKVFQPGDVLYGRLRPYLNKVYVAEAAVDSGVCSTEFFVLIPDAKRILPGYLRFILSSGYILQRVARLQTGSALPRVHLSDIMKMIVPLPPLDTQHVMFEFMKRQAERRERLLSELATIPQTTTELLMRALETGDCSLDAT